MSELLHHAIASEYHSGNRVVLTPETAFNQVKLEYNASKDEKVDKLREVMDAREKKYRVEN